MRLAARRGSGAVASARESAMSLARCTRRGKARGCGQLALTVARSLVLIFVVGCGAEPPQELPPPPEGAPVQVFRGLELRQSEAGKARWVLVADSAETFGEKARTRLWGIRVDFYGESGDSVRSTLTAREGEVDTQTRDLLARGNVVVNGQDGQRLLTEELRWDPAAGKVVSDSLVRVVKGSSVLTGIGIESDPELRSFVLRSRVTGELREEDRILDDF